jgi:hypothetical protein
VPEIVEVILDGRPSFEPTWRCWFVLRSLYFSASVVIVGGALGGCFAVSSASPCPPGSNPNASRWITALLARRPYKVVAVALANKMARIIWALLVKGGRYQENGASNQMATA